MREKFFKVPADRSTKDERRRYALLQAAAIIDAGLAAALTPWPVAQVVDRASNMLDEIEQHYSVGQS